MTTEQKPTKKQVEKLKSSFQSREDDVQLMRIYHRKRVEFFEQCNLFLNVTNAVAVVLALFLIGWQLAEKTNAIASVKTSLFFATFTVLFLFLSMLLDLTRKEEKHRWLESSYERLNQKFSEVYLTVWEESTASEYEKLTNLFHRIKDNMIILKAEEPPILQFELFLASQRRNIKEEEEIRILRKIGYWQCWMASFFSRTDALVRFLVNHNYEKLKKWEEQQEENKEKTS